MHNMLSAEELTVAYTRLQSVPDVIM